MTIFDALLLGIVQGISEFLPISSSGHLVLAENFLNLSHESLQTFDIAIHFGTLLAIILFFWKEYTVMAFAFFRTIGRVLKVKNIKNEERDPDQLRLIGWLVFGTIPALIVGFFWGDMIDEVFRDPKMVAGALIIVSFYFIWAEWQSKQLHNCKEQTPTLSWARVSCIGVAQAIALFHGVSRSGATISTGLALGMERKEAARFSFLLGSIAILAASTLASIKILKHEMALPPIDILLTGIMSSFVAGYFSISFLMKFLGSRKLYVFAAYRIALGVLLLALLR